MILGNENRNVNFRLVGTLMLSSKSFKQCHGRFSMNFVGSICITHSLIHLSVS